MCDGPQQLLHPLGLLREVSQRLGSVVREGALGLLGVFGVLGRGSHVGKAHT